MRWLYEDSGGGLHWTDGHHLVSGLEYSDAGSGLAELISMIGDADEFGDSIKAEIPDHWQLVAEVTDTALFTIRYKQCGNAARRYLGLPKE